MAGTAKTSKFMLGSASLMIGAQANLYDLSPTNSLGLVKNISITSDPTFTDLTQGTKNTVVYSMLTGSPVKISAEVYEYTAANLAYGLSLDGSSLTSLTAAGVTSAIIAGGTTPTTQVPLVDASMFAANDNILISDGTDDNLLPRKIVSIATNTLTVDSTIKQTLAAGATVRKVNLVDVGSTVDGPFLAGKIAGKLVDGTPVVLLLPKIRITKGFTMNWSTNDYGNLPYEIEVIDLISTDTFYANFTTKKAQLYIP